MGRQSSGPNPLQVIIAAALLIGLAWYFFGGGIEQQAEAGLDEIYATVAEDAVRQYRIAKANGGPMDACVQAGLVVAAFLQAQDEVAYSRWKKTERSDCAAAGVPAD